MRSDLLNKLADALEEDANNPKGVKFNLSLWGHTDDEKNLISCGTTACAMGLAVAKDLFVEEGLTSFKDAPYYAKFVPRYEVHGEDRVRLGTSAAAAVFEISENEAMWLFLPHSYKEGERKGAEGELAVAARLRGLADGSLKMPDDYKPYEVPIEAVTAPPPANG